MKLNKKGFTLVELLAVIVILALLMVVATRTIGGSLTNSKKSAMQTEAQKIISKSYEDIQTAILNGETMSSSIFTYGVSYTAAVTTAGSSTPAKVKLKDGTYNIVLTLNSDGTSVDKLCIDDAGTGTGNGYNNVTVDNGNTVSFTKDQDYDIKGGKCS